MRKVLALVLVAVMIVSVCSVLAACGKKEEKAEATTAATTASSSPAANNNNEAGNSNANNNANQSNDNAAAASSADQSADVAPEATSAEYSGETVIGSDQAIEFVMTGMGYDENYTASYNGTIQIPDGSVWHGVTVSDANGETVGSYYVSDTTGTVKTTSELEAYAYR